ncbi:MAG: nucleotide exchange factor GrpE [bacterium]
MLDEAKKTENREPDSVEITEQKDQTQDCVSISKEEYDNLLKSKKAQQDLLYVCADFDNFKKRSAKDNQQQIDFANERLIKAILPVLDNLNRATEQEVNELDFAKDHNVAKENVLKFVEGILLIKKQFEDVLEKFGVKEVNSVDQKFDPNFHEAMDHTESEKHDNGQVVKEYEKGYVLKGRLIRPSKVCVSKKKNKED